MQTSQTQAQWHQWGCLRHKSSASCVRISDRRTDGWTYGQADGQTTQKHNASSIKNTFTVKHVLKYCNQNTWSLFSTHAGKCLLGGPRNTAKK